MGAYTMVLQKKDIDHLAKLARIDISDIEKKKLLTDLQGIFGYMEKLSEVNVDKAEPMTGGSNQVNQFRGDDSDVSVPTPSEELRDAFPEKHDDYLKVPYVFE